MKIRPLKKNLSFALFFLIAMCSCLPLFSSGKRNDIADTVKSGSQKEIKKSLMKNIDLVYYKAPGTKNNLLHIALEAGREKDIVALLLKFGVSSSYKNSEGVTSLMYACKHNDPEIVELILDFDRYFSWQRRRFALKKDKNGLTAFDYSSENPEILSLLEKKTKYIYASAAESGSSLSLEEAVPAIAGENAVIGAGAAAGAIILAADPAENETASKNSETQDPLAAKDNAETNTENNIEHSAMEAGTIAAAAAAVTGDNETDGLAEKDSSGGEQDYSDGLEDSVSSGFSLSNVSVSARFFPVYLFDDFPEEKEYDTKTADRIVNAKITSKADANKADKHGRTQLMKAAADGDTDLIKNLIFSGANVNASDSDGWTAAMWCARYGGDYSSLKLLYENGADLKLKNKYGISALQLASCFSNNENIVYLLLEGRSPDEQEVKDSFISAICSDRSPAVIDAFLKNKLAINQFYIDGKTPLMLAAENCSKNETIAFLLQNGAEKSLRSREGKTAFDYANKNKKLDRDKTYWALSPNGGF
ncbi:ankyrin repeat domain-containing protein [Treponema parvum]|uniref:Ankyrin repeat domain-containing protein n=1 Tax=Treponema parvum TaxID=138851 RepID=A0A975EZG7_9SPIR|nr:ankyrin repeat domain-containing protein [Treponema parvum]QTQ11786.1 ankyrin repeat domain-containing protein [Treponema parvum]